MARQFCGTAEHTRHLISSLPEVIKRIGRTLEEKRLAIQRLKACPGSCGDGIVSIASDSGGTIRVSCPLASVNCSYGKWLQAGLDAYIVKIMLESGVPRRYVENLSDCRDSVSLKAACEWNFRGFLVLCGNSRTGKSFTAACVLRKYLQNRIPDCMDKNTWKEAEPGCLGVAWLNAAEVNGDREAAARAKSAHLLVLDDFGGESDAGGNHAAMRRVISARYEAALPAVITTELAIENIKARYGHGAAERIVGSKRDGGRIIECFKNSHNNTEEETL
jgi:hypothetical protein